jgi:putative endonuclease
MVIAACHPGRHFAACHPGRHFAACHPGRYFAACHPGRRSCGDGPGPRGPIHVGATAPTPVTFFMSGCYYVYILANRRYGTLYVGITNNIVRRVFEHRIDLVEGFTKEHQVHHLVWYESHDDVLQAIVREKRIKKWRRDWKVNLIQGINPEWKDLYEEFLE